MEMRNFASIILMRARERKKKNVEENMTKYEEERKKNISGPQRKEVSSSIIGLKETDNENDVGRS